MKKIVFEWELLARDFDRKDTSEIKIEPEYIENVKYEEVSFEIELPEEKIFTHYHVVEENKNNA